MFFMTGSALLGETLWFLTLTMRTLCNCSLTKPTIFSSPTLFFRLHIYTPNCLFNIFIQTFRGHLKFNTSKINVMLFCICPFYLYLAIHSSSKLLREQKNRGITSLSSLSFIFLSSPPWYIIQLGSRVCLSLHFYSCLLPKPFNTQKWHSRLVCLLSVFRLFPDQPLHNSDLQKYLSYSSQLKRCFRAYFSAQLLNNFFYSHMYSLVSFLYNIFKLTDIFFFLDRNPPYTYFVLPH